MSRRNSSSKPARSRARLLGVEELENRCVLSNLVWVNRGQDSDRFGEVFGANAEAARRVVDAVLSAWGTVLVDLKQPAIDAPADRNTINFTIGMHQTETGFGGAASITSWAFPTQADKDANRNGHPTAGTFTLSRGAAGEANNGWWIDPTPQEHSEFTNILSAFAASRPDDAVGTDLYGTINAEIAHILGLFDSAPSRLPTPISGTVTKTTLNDRAHGNGVGFYYVFDGPSGTHLLTSFDSGGGDVGGPTHTAGPSASNYPVQFTSQFRGAVRLTGAIDPGNAAGGSNTRVLVSDGLARLFKDAFGYEVRLPSTIAGATFAVGVQGQTLTVRGGPDGDGRAANQATANAGPGAGRGYDTFIPDYRDVRGVSADRITLRRDGTDLVVTFDFGRDGPIGGLDSDGDGNAPPFETRVPLSSFTSINLDTDGGNDVVTLDFSGGNFLPAGGLMFQGDLGVDELIVTGAQAYVVDGNTLTLPGLGTISLESVADVQLIGTSLDDTFEIRNWLGDIALDGLSGSDTYVADWSAGPEGKTRIFDSGGVADLVRVLGTSGDDFIRVAGSIVRSSGAAVDFRDAGIEQLTVDAADGNDVIKVGKSPVDTFVRLLGGIGNDFLRGGHGAEFLSGGDGDDFINGRGGDDIALGGDGNDVVRVALRKSARTLLIGGVGRDVLFGGGTGSLLIGGNTDYDDDEAALLSIHAVWARRNLSYALRLAQLRNGGTTNGANVLTAATVHDDGEIDTLFGARDQDWYWASVVDGDVVVRRQGDEEVN